MRTIVEIRREMEAIRTEHEKRRTEEFTRWFQATKKLNRELKEAKHFKVPLQSEVKDALDRLDGTGDFYGDMGNPCYADGHYANSLKQKWGKSLNQLREYVKTGRWDNDAK